MQLVGKVLWWDKKDQNGIIVDALGNEFYFDISVITGRKATYIKPGAVVQFSISQKNTGTSAASAVVVPLAKAKPKLEREFEKNLQLSFQV